MTQITPLTSDHFNNPSKELVPGSGLYSQVAYGVPVLSNNVQTFYSANIANSIIPNTGIFVTTTSTTPQPMPHALNSSNLSNTIMHRIDDMSVINNYIHYYGVKKFDPRSFLTQATINFNLYSRVYR